MVINVKRVEIIEKQVTVDIKPNIYLLIVKFTLKDNSEYVQVIQTDTLDGYIDYHDCKDYEVLKVLIYALNAEKDGNDFIPNYNGKRLT